MFLPVKQAACSGTLNRIMDMIQNILDYSVRTLIQELDFDELSGLIEPALRALLEKKQIREDIEDVSGAHGGKPGFFQ